MRVSSLFWTGVDGTDGGMWRLVPFTPVVPEAQRNPSLEKKFIPELPGILNWCLRALMYWHEHQKSSEEEWPFDSPEE